MAQMAKDIKTSSQVLQEEKRIKKIKAKWISRYKKNSPETEIHF